MCCIEEIGLFLIIDAPHFYAGYDLETDNIAPIIRYMKPWSIQQIIQYCEKKGWKVIYYE